MRHEELQAVIESAKSRGTGSLDRMIRKRLPGASENELVEARDLAIEIIESVPVFLARAEQEARDRNLVMVVQPILDHAARYFLRPVDLIPEMTHGLAGLVDDAYLVLRILDNLDRGPEPFLDWDLEHPLGFLRRLAGRETSEKLDAISLRAVDEISDQLDRAWHHLAHRA